jgi:leucyl aminopeptidase
MFLAAPQSSDRVPFDLESAYLPSNNTNSLSSSLDRALGSHKHAHSSNSHDKDSHAATVAAAAGSNATGSSDSDKNKKRAKKIQEEKEKRKRSYRTVKRRTHAPAEEQSITMAALGTTNTTTAPGQVERIYRLSPSHKSITHNMSQRKDDNPATQNKRYRIIRELVDTERSYVTSLQTAVTVFVDKMRRLVGTPNEVATPEEIDTVFSNIKEIASISIGILQELRVRTHSATWTAESRIGDFFLEFLDRVCLNKQSPSLALCE